MFCFGNTRAKRQERRIAKMRAELESRPGYNAYKEHKEREERVERAALRVANLIAIHGFNSNDINVELLHLLKGNKEEVLDAIAVVNNHLLAAEYARQREARLNAIAEHLAAPRLAAPLVYVQVVHVPPPPGDSEH
jgi:hypothetical protein